MNAIQKFDENAMLAVRKLHHPAPLWAFRALTWTGTGYAWLIYAVFIHLFIKSGIYTGPRPHGIPIAMLPSFLTYLIGNILKRLIERKRPPDAIPGYRSFGQLPNCGSFPSGHAAAAIAFTTALFVMGHPLALQALIWALLICFSRFYLGVHFPSDIFGGAILGIACGLSVNQLRHLLTIVI